MTTTIKGMLVPSFDPSAKHNHTEAYTVKIGEKWFHIEKVFGTITKEWNGVPRDCSHLMGECYAYTFDFKMVECEAPEQELPSEVAQFVERYQQTGETSGKLVEINPRCNDVPQSVVAGWK